MDESFHNELQAISELGTRRSKLRTTFFVLGYVGACLLLYGIQVTGLRIGLLYVLILAVPIAASFSIAVVSAMTPKLVKQVAEQFGVPESKLGQGEFLVD